jgi:hypothetical protein
MTVQSGAHKFLKRCYPSGGDQKEMSGPVGSTGVLVGPGRAVGPDLSDKRPRYPVGRRADLDPRCSGCMALATRSYPQIKQ